MLAITIVVVAFVALLFFFATYKVVPPNEAHVIVFMGRGRYVKSVAEKDGKKGSTAYFLIPFIMQRYILPLTNVKLDITDIELNDKEVAPFVADVVTWLYIDDPIKAAERLDLTAPNVFTSLHQDLKAIVQAIARTVAMKQEILDIMRDRKTFSQNVSVDVNGVLQKWGVELINLEVNDIRDSQNSTIIKDYEAMRQAAVNSTARIAVATREREAVEKEQENKKLAEVATAEAKRVYSEKQIETDRAIGVATQEKEKQVAVSEQSANEQKVHAFRVLGYIK
jgi:regulator of protease activity HflC (stomatin/prohibitin superfamily)